MSFIPSFPKRGVFEVQPVLDAIKGYGVICGGYARFVLSPRKDVAPAGDVDVYACQQFGTGPTLEPLAVYEILKEKLLSMGLFNKAFETPRALSLRKKSGAPYFGPEKLQVIKPVQEGRLLTYGTIHDILDNFDFSVARAAVVDATRGFVDVDFDQDEIDQVLRIKRIQCPISGALRIAKYSEKGYGVRSREIYKLFEEWNRRGPEWQTSITAEFAELDRLEAELKKTDSSETQERVDNHLQALYDRLSID